jgi:hypothetical protein
VAKFCPHCGASIANNDAHLCNTCGSALVAEPVGSATPPSSAKPGLHEQTAYESFASADRAREEDEEKQRPREIQAKPVHPISAEQQQIVAAWPAPLTEADSVNESSSDEESQEDLPTPIFPSPDARRGRRVRTKDQADEEHNPVAPASPSVDDESGAESVEDRPTLLMQGVSVSDAQSAASSSAVTDDESGVESVEDRPTLLMQGVSVSDAQSAASSSAATDDESGVEAAGAIEDRSTLLMKGAVVSEARQSASLSQSTADEDEPIEERPTLVMKSEKLAASAVAEESTQPLAHVQDVGAASTLEGLAVEQFDTMLLPQSQISSPPVGDKASEPAIHDDSQHRPSPIDEVASSSSQPGFNPSSAPGVAGGPENPPSGPGIVSGVAVTSAFVPPHRPGSNPSSAPGVAGGPAFSPPSQRGANPLSRAGIASGLVTLVGSARSKFGRTASPRLLLVGALLVVFVIVGSVLVVSFSQRSTNDPWTSYSESSLNFSTRYPTDWKVKAETGKAHVQFADYNQTAQFSVTVSNTNPTDAKQFAHQQAEKAGVSDVKDASQLSFGGVTWQRVEGDLVSEGVTYHVQFLATVRDKRAYLIVQQATKDTYSANESVFFKEMRNSWGFI